MAVSGSNFYIIQIGSGSGCPQESRFSIDQIRILDHVPEVPIKITSWGTLRAL